MYIMISLVEQVTCKGYNPPHKYSGRYQPNQKDQGLQGLAAQATCKGYNPPHDYEDLINLIKKIRV